MKHGTWPAAALAAVVALSGTACAQQVAETGFESVGRGWPLAADLRDYEITGPTVPIATTGVIVAVVSGIGLLSTNATEYQDNPFLLIKFPAILVALLNVAFVTSRSGWKTMGLRESTPAERRTLAICGGVSLAAWLTAIGAGRMIGYW